MPAFDQKHVDAAIARIVGMGTKELQELQLRAQKQGLPELAAACTEELAQRPLVLSPAAAKDHERSAQAVADLSLTDAVRYAFTKFRPLSVEETRFLHWAAKTPAAPSAKRKPCTARATLDWSSATSSTTGLAAFGGS